MSIDVVGLSNHPARSAAAVALVALATFILTPGYDFAFDDQLVIPATWQVGAGSLLDVLRAPVQAKSIVLPYFRPLTALSYALDGTIWRGNPGGFHLTNLLLHVAVSVLVFAVARRLLLPGPAPLLAGLLFAVHPIHVEAVAWVQGRVDLLATTGVLLAVLLGVAGVEAGGRRRRLLCWTASTMAFLAALLAKEVAIVTPLLAAVVVAGKFDREAWPRVRASAPLLALMGAAIVLYLGLRTLALGGVTLGLSGGPALQDRVLLALRVIPLSLRLLVWPIGLNPTHVVAPPSGLLDADLWLGVLLALLVVALGIWGRQTPGVGVGLAWLTLAWLPASNLLPITGFVVAERYLYLPSAGLCLAVAGAAARMFEGEVRWRNACVAAVGGLLLTLGGLAAVQAELWRDPRSFYEGLVRRNPDSPLARNNLGEVYLVSGEDARAEEAFRAALRLHAADAGALSNLGLVAQRRGDFPEARRLYREALAVRPNHAEAWNNLGTLYEAEKEWGQAEAAYREAVRLAPATARYLGNLADVLMVRGRHQEAAALLERAIALDPAGARWHEALQALRPDGRRP